MKNNTLLALCLCLAFVPTCLAEPAAEAAAEQKPVIGKLYWVGGNMLARANGDGSQMEILAKNLDAPDGLVLDLPGNTVYWTNMSLGPNGGLGSNGSLQRRHLDGSAIDGDGEFLVEPGTFEIGKEIELDTATQKLYWADRDGKRVLRANADGSQVEIFVAGFKDESGSIIPLENPVGIALDEENRQVYFTDRFMGKIMRAPMSIKEGTLKEGEAPYERSDVTVLFDGEPGQDRLIDIDLDLINQKMYWTDRGRHHVARANLNGSKVEILVSPDNHEIENPIGMSLDLANKKMIWTDMTTHAIHRANLNGTEIETLLSGDKLLNGVGYGPLGISWKTLQPDSGSIEGGTEVTLLGDNFVNDNTDVMVGNREAENVQVINKNLLTFTTPAQPTGRYSITVITPEGEATSRNIYHYR